MDDQLPDAATVNDANVARLMADVLPDVADRAALTRLDEQGRVQDVITFAHLHEIVGSCAGALRERGLGRGSRALVFLPMGLELYVTLLSLFRLGAIAMFVDESGSRRAVEQVARQVDPDAFIGTPRSHLLRLQVAGLRGLDVSIATGHRRVPGAELLRDIAAHHRDRPVVEPVRMDAHDPAMVLFGSRDDGTQLGTNRTHGLLLAQHEVLAREVPDAEGAVLWSQMPVVTLQALGRGMPSVLPPPDVAHDPLPDPRQLHGLVDRSGANLLVLGPAQLAQLSKAPGRTPLSQVERVFVGGGPTTPSLLDAAQAVLPRAAITAIYGAPEVDPIASAPAQEILARRDEMRTTGGLYVGGPLDGVQVRVVRAVSGPIEVGEGGSLDDWTVAPEAPGEILVAAPHVNRDYWGDADDARVTKVRDEHGVLWHRTGDIGRRDEHGALWLLGRRGAGWSVGGQRRMWGLEIETPITDLPEVERAAVCMPRFEGSTREFKNASAVVAVEPADGFDRVDARDATIRSLRARRLDSAIEVRSLKRIPTNRRRPHKVDVERLHRMLKPQNTDDY